MSYEHGHGCSCYECEGRREMQRRSEHAGVAWENNGSGHSAASADVSH